MGDGHGSSASAVVERGPVLTGASGSRFHWFSQDSPSGFHGLASAGKGAWHLF